MPRSRSESVRSVSPAPWAQSRLGHGATEADTAALPTGVLGSRVVRARPGKTTGRPRGLWPRIRDWASWPALRCKRGLVRQATLARARPRCVWPGACVHSGPLLAWGSAGRSVRDRPSYTGRNRMGVVVAIDDRVEPTATLRSRSRTPGTHTRRLLSPGKQQGSYWFQIPTCNLSSAPSAYSVS
jgi:hypothetical protein